MADSTKSQWWDVSWSPVTGGTKVTLHPDRLEQPLRWRKSRRIAVCLMGDLLHEDVPFEFIDKMFAIMAMCPQHIFFLLTKRVEQMAEYLEDPLRRMYLIGQKADWFRKVWKRAAYWSTATGKACEEIAFEWPLPNVHLGTSIEDQPSADRRIPELLKCPAAVTWVNYEPALGPIDLRLCPHPDDILGCDRNADDPNEDSPVACTECPSGRHWVNLTFEPPPYTRNCGIDWVIVGAETGPGARWMDPDWARSIRDQCRAAGVPFFMKSVSGKQPIPDDLMIREFPT